MAHAATEARSGEITLTFLIALLGRFPIPEQRPEQRSSPDKDDEGASRDDELVRKAAAPRS